MAGRTFRSFRSNKGFPVFYEQGAGNEKMATVQLIASDNYFPKKPIFTNRPENKTIPQYNHVLFVVKQGDKIITASKVGKTKSFELHTVIEIREEMKSYQIICSEEIKIEDATNMPFEAFVKAASDKLDNPNEIKSYFCLNKEEAAAE